MHDLENGSELCLTFHEAFRHYYAPGGYTEDWEDTCGELRLGRLRKALSTAFTSDGGLDLSHMPYPEIEACVESVQSTLSLEAFSPDFKKDHERCLSMEFLRENILKAASNFSALDSL